MTQRVGSGASNSKEKGMFRRKGWFRKNGWFKRTGW
jgi:hypothetical protein